MGTDWLALGADGAAVVLLLGYHLRLVADLRRRPLATAIGRNRVARDAWVRKVVAQSADLLAVQTLRNWTMTGTFLASTAILIGIGIVHFVFAAGQPATASVVVHGAGGLASGIGGRKLLLLASLFFASFFCFAQTLRALNHLVFSLPVAGADGVTVNVEQLNQGANHFTLGMRGFYLALPVALWLFGSFYFLGATCLLLVVLRRIDYQGGALAPAQATMSSNSTLDR
jgi:uncharacterized membrane protein